MSIYESVVNNPFFIIMRNANEYIGCFKDFKYYNQLILNLSNDESLKEIFELDENQELTHDNVVEFFEVDSICIVPYYNLDLNKSIYISLTGNYRLKSVSNTKPIKNNDVLIKISIEEMWKRF